MSKETGYLLKGLFVILLISAQIVGLLHSSLVIPSVKAEELPEQWDYNDGSWTLIDKLGLPIRVNLPIGDSWTYVFNLDNDTEYHIYFHGDWIGSTTDYDIAVYDPDGIRISYHTESHGLIEHLGTTVTDPLFKPEKDGEYSIYIWNDPKESNDALNGTLMVSENLKVNSLYENKLYMEGKDPVTNEPRFYTTWVYEFNTTSNRIEVPIEVPESLDMYEARLYLMADPARGLGTDLLGIPIAWEPGLYNGTSSSSVGGSNVDDTGYRGNVFDSGEYKGEDMILNYTSTSTGNLLYHLVFIAEVGTGNVTFWIRTEFVKPYLNVSMPSTVYADETAIVTAIANDIESGMDKVILSYSTDDGVTWITTDMLEGESQTYTGEIPGQPLGTTVLYKVEARDNAGNKAVEEGSYLNKYQSQISSSLSASQIISGESITVEGSINPPQVDADIVIQYSNPLDEVVSQTVKTGSLGNFSDTFTPDIGGVWSITASWSGNQVYAGSSNTTLLTVDKVTMILNIALDKQGMTFGDTLEITGSLSPAVANAIIKLYLSDPEGAVRTELVQASAQGTYSFKFTPDSKGSWTITATFSGDSSHKAASSQSIPIVVSGGLFDMPYVLIFPAAAVAIVVVVIFMIRRRRSTSIYEGY
ncbi:hypothetical protein DRO66_04955 [Candidatus Bathyarchaeota archaeon]|nr:MAG: hypothetical protein DRO66_04955 [Candidatus Bathyarchaeota archaeon]